MDLSWSKKFSSSIVIVTGGAAFVIEVLCDRSYTNRPVLWFENVAVFSDGSVMSVSLAELTDAFSKHGSEVVRVDSVFSSFRLGTTLSQQLSLVKKLTVYSSSGFTYEFYSESSSFVHKSIFVNDSVVFGSRSVSLVVYLKEFVNESGVFTHFSVAKTS